MLLRTPLKGTQKCLCCPSEFFYRAFVTEVPPSKVSLLILILQNHWIKGRFCGISITRSICHPEAAIIWACWVCVQYIIDQKTDSCNTQWIAEKVQNIPHKSGPTGPFNSPILIDSRRSQMYVPYIRSCGPRNILNDQEVRRGPKNSHKLLK